MLTQYKKGVLELVVMLVVAKEDLYGYELVKQVNEIVDVNEGTLYPLLKRMTNDGTFVTYYQESNSGPQRKYYHITESGIAIMKNQKKEWLAFSNKINKYIEGTK